MPKISVHRKKNWMISSKMYEVFLDEQRIGHLYNGETNEFEVPAGEHKLKVKIDRSGSKDFSFTMFNNETKSFTVSMNYMRVIIIVILGVLYIPVIFLLQHYLRTLKLDHIYSMLAPALIIIVAFYFIYIGRNTYLKIKEG